MKLLLLGVVGLLAVGCGRSPQFYIGRGNQQFAERKFADASLQYRKALQKDPDSWEAHYWLGLTFREQGQFGAAWPELRCAVELAPSDEQGRQDLSALTLAAYLAGGSTSRAFHDDLEKQAAWFLSRSNSSFEGWRLKTYLAMGDHQPGDAAEFAVKANAANPMEPDITPLWTQALLQTGKGEQAEQVAHAFLSQRKDAPALYDVMYKYYAGKQRFAEAESMLAEKARAFPADAAVRVQVAGHYARRGSRDKESAALAEVLGSPRQYPMGRLGVAEYRLQGGAVDEGIRLLEAGAHGNPGEALPCFRLLAEIRQRRGDRKAALASVSEGLRRFPSDSLLVKEQAEPWLDSGEPEGRKAALDSLKTLSVKTPHDASVRFLLGRALAIQGRTAEAGAEFRESIQLDPSSIAPRVAAAELDLQGGRTQEALKLLDEALARAPSHLAARELRVTALRAEGRYKEVRQALKTLQEQFPGNPALQIETAHDSLREGKTAEAEAIFRKLYKPGQEDVRPLMGIVDCRMKRKDPAGAQRLLEMDLVKTPGRPFVRMMLGRALAAGGRPDRAAEQYKLALDAAPDSPALYRRLGQLYASTGDSEKAIANLRRSLELNPASLSTVSLLAEQCDLAGQAAEAERYYRRWLELEPETVPAQNNLAYLLAEKGNVDKALALAQKVCRKTGQLAPTADTLGWVYLKKKMTSSALEIFRGLVRRYPDVAIFRYHLGLTLIESGNRSAARSELETALTKHPSRADEMHIREALVRLS
jgi:tetratricopeptide (TPR) repeat protein